MKHPIELSYMADVPIYNHSPPEGINLHTQTHEDIVNSNINMNISQSISASNPDRISADSSLNSIASIRLCKSNLLNNLRILID